MQKISESVYVETGYDGCNVGFVVTSEGIVMIDTPMAPRDAIDWRNRIAGHGRVRYLINTEPHGDHFSGNYFFEGIIIGHEGTREAILGSPVERFRDMLRQISTESEPLEAGFCFRAPEITLSQGLTLHLGAHTFRLINMPGHTPYEVAVYIPEEKTVFTSDNIFHETMPFMQQALPFAWLKSLEALEQLEADYLVPGHGGVCDRSYLPRMADTIQDWINAVTETMVKGLSVEQAQAELSFADRYPSEDRERLLGVQLMNVTRLYEALAG